MASYIVGYKLYWLGSDVVGVSLFSILGNTLEDVEEVKKRNESRSG